MLLPQVPVMDVYDEQGQQYDDITSIAELSLTEIGYVHCSDDENDDNGQTFCVPHFEYTFSVMYEKVNKCYKNAGSQLFVECKTGKVIKTSYDILVPPPDVV